MRFRDRQEGGQQLAAQLERYRGESPIVLALPRGGVPVAYQVARALGAPLDVLVSRKLGAPRCPEYAIGAIAEGGAIFIDPGAAADTGVDESALATLAEQEAAELARRVARYRGGRGIPNLRGRTVILVDDGVATGGTARAAIRAARERRPRRLVFATPVVALDTVAALRPEVDDLVYVQAPEEFLAVGFWYEQFPQTTDEEVVSLLERARRALSAGGDPGDPWSQEWIEGAVDPPASVEREMAIPLDGREIWANLTIPPGAASIVLFAHGSGSGRTSPRNRYVARALRDAGLATLLLDLLTSEEEMEDEMTGRLRFDTDFLAQRLVAATRLLQDDQALRRLRVGLFGASTGAAAALVAAAELPAAVGAVVSRGGRPDLAGPTALCLVRAPTLLIVGGRDQAVLALNRLALDQLGAGVKKLAVVPGAGHLFEETGKLEVVARLAVQWFSRHLPMQESLPGESRADLNPP